MSATVPEQFTFALDDDELLRLVVFAVEMSESDRVRPNATDRPYQWRFDSAPGRMELGFRVGADVEALTVVLDLDRQAVQISVTPGLRKQLRQLVQASLENLDTLEREAEHSGVDVALEFEGLLDRLEERREA